jgi:hypothetical protein
MSTKKNSHTKSKLGSLFSSGRNVITLLVLAGIGLTAFLAFDNAQTGEKVPIMSDTSHILEGTDPNPYNSNPPTSGIHYSEDLKPGFYTENTYEYPEGYLVHNLEHGYIIFWYNCSLLSDTECSTLKSQIKAVMDEKNNFKLIAYPWQKTDVPLVLTSWGRILPMESFDRDAALDFYRRNINKAPEPHAD